MLAYSKLIQSGVRASIIQQEQQSSRLQKLFTIIITIRMPIQHQRRHLRDCYITASKTLKPDLYYEKSLRHALRQALRQPATGETPVAGCRKLSQRLIAKVEPGSTFATACIATWDATCTATWETQVVSWALANHVCFPPVALDLRQNSINRPSPSHVTATCRVSHVAAIFS